MAVDAGIVVVGAGPTGLTLACQLHRQGVPCRVIDQAPEPTSLSRAVGLSTRSLEVLDELGAAQDAIERGHPIAVANFYSRRGRIGRVTTAGLRGTRFPFILGLPQHDTERVLQDRLGQLGGSVERNTALRRLRQHPEGASLEVDGPDGPATIEARWVVGADGAHSAVRKLSGIDFAGKATQVVFAIVDAQVDDGPAGDEGHYYFSPEGLLVVVPLPDGTYRFAATIDPKGRPDSALDLGHVQALVDRRVPHRRIRLRDLRNAGWGAAQVRIHTRLAQTFRAGRCVLAGDAAHIHSPVGGQGVNVGIQDAHNLAWKLALVATGRAPESLLDTYEVERRHVAQEVTKATMMQTRMATVRSRPGRAVRDALVARATKKGLLDRKMAPQLAQVAVDYRHSPGIAAAGKSDPQGKRIPDTPLDGPAEAPPTLFGLLRDHPFTVLALSPGRADLPQVADLAEMLRSRFGGLVGVHVLWPGASGAPRSGADLVDRGSELHEHLSVDGPTLCLVRPDGHVAHLAPLAASPSLLAHLEGTLNAAPPAPGDTAAAAPVPADEVKSA